MLHKEIKLIKDWDWKRIFTEDEYCNKKDEYDNKIENKLRTIFKCGFNAISFDRGNGRYLILSKSLRDKEMYSLTYFDHRGPIMHEDYFITDSSKANYENSFSRLCSVIQGNSGDRIVMDII